MRITTNPYIIIYRQIVPMYTYRYMYIVYMYVYLHVWLASLRASPRHMYIICLSHSSFTYTFACLSICTRTFTYMYIVHILHIYM